MLVMGPWRHGGWARGDGRSFGDIPFNSKTSEFYREKIEFPFFQVISRTRRCEPSRSLGVRNGHQPVAAIRQLAPRPGQGNIVVLPRRRATLV